MRVTDMVNFLDDATVERCRSEAAKLSKEISLNESGEPVDWFAVLIERAYKEETDPPFGWFRWWDE